MAKDSITFFVALLLFQGCTILRSPQGGVRTDMDTLEVSRNSCVRITSISGNSRGSGFFISAEYVATCFHVIAAPRRDGDKVNLNIFSDLKVTTVDGEEFAATCISVPTDADPSPLLNDFAVLKVEPRPKKSLPLKIAADDAGLILGADVVFSGYPLATPGMVTHRGMISGWSDNKDLIFIQGAINKGNSGGALISTAGDVIGIVSMREGGIGKGLADLVDYIDKSSGQGSVLIMGVDPLQATKAIVETLNTYISTGIGYAHSAAFLRKWVSSRKLALR